MYAFLLSHHVRSMYKENSILRYKRRKRAVGALAVSELPVWPHVSNHIFLYKFMRT